MGLRNEGHSRKKGGGPRNEGEGAGEAENKRTQKGSRPQAEQGQEKR